jgi:polysaccharide chain length determinant protein (PEP-CTERM system associated)
MLGHRQLNLDDYLEILRRRWWVILIPTLVVGVGAYVRSLFLANQFTSRTLVLVEQQKVPESYVKSVVAGDIGERLGTMQEQILSRTRLQPIIEKFGLFKDEKGKVAAEDLVDRLRKSVSVTPIRSLISSGTDELPGFTISFTASDPRLAQQVCAEITSMFIEENLRLREQRAEGTTDFLRTELDQAKQALDAQDAKLAEFKSKYIGALPGNEQTQMNMMAGLSSQLDAVTSQLYRVQQDKAYQESALAQQLSAWQMSQKSGEPREDTLEKQLANSQAQLVAMEAHYTASHPDVLKLKEDVAALKRRIEENRARANDKTAQAQEPAGGTEPPEIQKLRFQIHQAEVFIREKTREQARLKEQLGVYQGRLSMSPVVEQKYKELTRDYQTALQFYNELLTKKSQSEMATSLERRQQGEQFRVMDPPDLPERPSYPNRPLFAGGGLGVGLALGIGITLLLELQDKSLRTEDDVQHFLGLPTLAMVPLISDRKGVKKQADRPADARKARLGPSARA